MPDGIHVNRAPVLTRIASLRMSSNMASRVSRSSPSMCRIAEQSALRHQGMLMRDTGRRIQVC